MNIADKFAETLMLPHAQCMAHVDSFNPQIAGSMGNDSYVLIKFTDDSGIFIDRLRNSEGSLDYTIVHPNDVAVDVAMLCLDMMVLKPNHPFSQEQAPRIFSTLIASSLETLFAELEGMPISPSDLH